MTRIIFLIGQLLITLFILPIFSGKITAQSVPSSADVVVAGAGTGGIAAAIQAARLGSKVLLVEETDWIGGQMTAAGVSTIDDADPRWGSGIYAEFLQKVRSHYAGLGKSVGTCYWGTQNTCIEPHVGKNILNSMISKEPNITLLLRTGITSVQKQGNTVTSVRLSSGETVSTKILIDATEYGDILPLAGISYRSGKTVSPNINSSACIQSITYLAIIKKYSATMPSGLLMSEAPPGYSRSEWTPLMTNAGYKGSDADLWSHIPMSFEYHNAFRGLPDSSRTGSYTSHEYEKITKTGINLFNDFQVTARYLEDKPYRQSTNCQAKLKTLQLLYYIQNDLGYKDWSVSLDEGYNTPYNREENSCSNIPAAFTTIVNNMPPIPYVRESRRMVGNYTLTGKDIQRVGTPPRGTTFFSDSVAVGDYAADLHHCKSSSDFESSLESSSDYPTSWMTGPFQIPLRSLVNTTVPNVIAAEKNISQSRIANGATRLHPPTMHIGQAAGALAALSVKSSTLPPQIHPLTLQKELIKAKLILYPHVDVSPGHQYFATAQEIALRGVLVGNTSLDFDPAGSLSRAQIAVILTKTFNLNPAVSGVTFSDVLSTHWAYPYIEALYRAKIISGCSTNPLKFCPDDAVTNAQLAVMLLNGWKNLNPAVAPHTPTSPTYQDVPSSHWAYPFIEGLAKNGIVWNCSSSRFCPDTVISRGKTAEVIIRLLNSPQFNATPTSVPGNTWDLNGSGRVDIFDYNMILSAFGSTYDLFDYNSLMANFGK